jgi:hypothetical protein
VPGQPVADRLALGVGDTQVLVGIQAAARRRGASSSARRRSTSPAACPTITFIYNHKTSIQ